MRPQKKGEAGPWGSWNYPSGARRGGRGASAQGGDIAMLLIRSQKGRRRGGRHDQERNTPILTLINQQGGGKEKKMGFKE